MHISLCRAGYGPLLREELLGLHSQRFDPLSQHAASLPSIGQEEEGWLAWEPGRAARNQPGMGRPSLAAPPLIFERQRLSGARFLRADSVNALVETLLTDLAENGPAPSASTPASSAEPLWLHAFAPEAAQAPSLAGRAARVAARLGERNRALPEAGRWRLAQVSAQPEQPGHGMPHPTPAETVWQVCCVPGGAWSAIAPARELIDSRPGGAHRMRMDPGAPSRSYLKIEEALAVTGWRPAPRERVIDLGAAPGGWSYAMLKRGCRVLAVDNGPLKIADLDALPGQLHHLREDGMRFRPPRDWLPADWLLGDMLIAPGACLGLLRKWVDGGWARRFIVNVKLPQKHPLAALAPLREFLAEIPGLQWRMRQLYHDRREVTLMGELTRASLAASPGKGAAKGPGKAPAKSPADRTPRAPGRKSGRPTRPKPGKSGRGKSVKPGKSSPRRGAR